uniref:Uncharacterized protein n=1 Tax=Oryza glumipatula TaxID=40148 RepID=A0A0D9Z6A7_9ORYZ
MGVGDGGALARRALETTGHLRGGHWRRRGSGEVGSRWRLVNPTRRSSSLLGEWVGVLETTPLRRSSHRASTGGGEAGAGAEELEEGGPGVTGAHRRPRRPPPPGHAPLPPATQSAASFASSAVGRLRPERVRERDNHGEGLG